MIEVATELVTSWDRYQRWATLCIARRCAYTDLAGNQADPPWQGGGNDRCPGYAGFLSVEDEHQVLRVRSCDRKVAWAKRRATFVRDGRKQAREREKVAK